MEVTPSPELQRLIEDLQREINIGMEQSRRGESTALDMDAIRQKVRERSGAAPR